MLLVTTPTTAGKFIPLVGVLTNNSPRLRFAGRPSLLRKEGEEYNFQALFTLAERGSTSEAMTG